MGENGCGKSTLIKIIAGVLPPDAGATIAIRGREWKRLNAIDSISQGIQVIYQDLALFPNLTVAENIAVSQYIQEKRPVVSRRGDGADSPARRCSMVSVSLDLSTAVEELSIAKQQLVAICRSITRGGAAHHHGRAHLQPGQRRRASTCSPSSAACRQKGITTLFVGHKLNEIFEIADRVTVLRDGQGMGTFEICAAEPGAAHRAHDRAGRSSVSTLRQELPRRTGPLAGGAGSSPRRASSRTSTSRLRPGEILGITGLVGSGRTELALSIFGMNRPDSGEILVEGMPRRIRSVPRPWPWASATSPRTGWCRACSWTTR